MFFNKSKYRIKIYGVPKTIRNLIEFNISHHGYTLEGMYQSPNSALCEYIEKV